MPWQMRFRGDPRVRHLGSTPKVTRQILSKLNRRSKSWRSTWWTWFSTTVNNLSCTKLNLHNLRWITYKSRRSIHFKHCDSPLLPPFIIIRIENRISLVGLETSHYIVLPLGETPKLGFKHVLNRRRVGCYKPFEPPPLWSILLSSNNSPTLVIKALVFWSWIPSDGIIPINGHIIGPLVASLWAIQMKMKRRNRAKIISAKSMLENAHLTNFAVVSYRLCQFDQM